MADSSGQPAAQRIGALRVNDCRWGRLAQNFSRNPRPVPSYPCTVVVSSVRGKRLTSCRRSGAGIAAASSTISHAAFSFDASSASGAIKRNVSPAKLASTSTALRVGAVTMASPQAGAGACPPARTSPSTLRRHRRDTGRQAYQLLKDCRLLGLRAAIGGMPVWTLGGQRETWPVRLPPEQHLRIGDKLPTAAVNKVRGNDRVRRIAPAQRVLIRPGRPVGEGASAAPASFPPAACRSGPPWRPHQTRAGHRKRRASLPAPAAFSARRAPRRRRNRLGANPQAIAAEPLP